MSAQPMPAPRRAAGPDTGARPALRVVTPPARRAGHVVFIVACGTLLVGGLAGVLWLNTAMAADAFEKHSLTQEIADLAEQRAIVLERINAHEAPASLAEAARALGMVPGTQITYVRLLDGTMIGEPVAAGEEGAEGTDGETEGTSSSTQSTEEVTP